MTVKDIYPGAERIINEFLRDEFAAQGHTLTGAAEASLSYKVTSNKKEDVMAGTMVDYAKYVRDGFPAESASWSQFPFIVRYFIARGYPSGENGTVDPDTLTAERLAAMTIKKWMKEGMSTEASKRFSKTGKRQGFIEDAFTANGQKLDEYMSNSLDFLVDEEYHKEKSETI